jgi:DNA-binding winged helix-turn-helix (wHTH) protein/tetratricopeptide (TPR) repeat protein
VNDPSGANTKIDLAQEADFVLGGLRISPSACRVASGGDEERIEPRVMEVLIVLARSAGRTVTREQLIEACWDGRAVSDDAVTRVIAKLRALGRADPPHFTLETIPKVGFRLIARPVESEISEPGTSLNVTRENGLAKSEPTARGADHETGRWKTLGTGGAITLAVAALAIATWGFARSPAQRVSETPHIVVSPLNVMQTQAELHRLAGVTTTALVRSLTGAGIQTSMSTSTPSRRSEIGLSTVMLAGSAHFDGVTYHVNVTAADRESNRVLWSGLFERPAAELRGLDEEVAYDVTAVLRCAFKARSSDASMPSEVFVHFMNACEGLIGWRSHKALEATQRLLALAPTHADAHAFRAIALNRRAETLDHLSKEAQDSLGDAHAEAQRALELDPAATAAHVALGEIMDTKRNFEESERHFQRAMEIDPADKRALDRYAQLLRQVGRVGAARELYGRLSTGPGPLIQGAFLQAASGNEVAAAQLLDRLAVIRPSWERGARYTVTAFWTAPAAALSKLPQFLDSEEPRDIRCLETHLKTLNAPAAQRRPGLSPDCEAFAVDWRVRMLARQGDVNGAYETIKQLPNSRSFYAFLFYPEMKAFRHDKRFMPLADSLGLVKYWRETNQWPDFCAEPDLPYDCRARDRSN